MYEQPNFSTIPEPAFHALVDHVSAMSDTEKRQEFAWACFPHAPQQYVRLMQAVHANDVAGGDDDDRIISSEARKTYLKALGRELGLKRVSDEKRAEWGYEEQEIENGGDWLFDGPTEIVTVWGDGDDVLLAEGEALMLCGQPGVGKTTVAHQFIRARMGFESKALGFTVQPTKSKVLYLACDRPTQARRALLRRFKPEERDAVNERLAVRKGPPVDDFATEPDSILKLCVEAGADTVVIDSLKDVVQGDIGKPEVGSGYNRARQMAMVNGITVVELHHQTKYGPDGKAPNTLASVFGSAWLTAGAGSVILLDGQAGDLVVKFRHLKQPMNQIGPIDLYHDHQTGISFFADKVNWSNLAMQAPLTVKAAAEIKYETAKPTRSEVETTRRELDAEVRAGRLKLLPGLTAKAPATYVPVTLKDYEGAPEAAQAAEQDTLH
jgi:replicative DNA helicase